MESKKRVAVIGGGAAGFFCAINLKELCPQAEVNILERGPRVLTKVEISGGGRCNCTNTFEGVTDLSSVYPRGHRLLKRLFHQFDYQDAYVWFERHGVPLTRQDDHCVFPKAQDSHAIIDCFLEHARRYGIRIETRHGVSNVDSLAGYDAVCVATGGSPTGKGLSWLRDMGHEIEEPVPSLFSLSIKDGGLRDLMGIVAEQAIAYLPGTKLRTQGPLLITHWGLSGPAILKLSSHGARLLHQNGYRMPLGINWTGENEGAVRACMEKAVSEHPQRQLSTTPPLRLQQRLWSYLAGKSIDCRRGLRWCDIGKRDMNRLVSVLCSDSYETAGRAPFKDEFVTCGGVSLRSIHPNTMESRVHPGLYFAGEVLDIDGVTGGFNFQAAWTTGYVAAKSIAERLFSPNNLEKS